MGNNTFIKVENTTKFYVSRNLAGLNDYLTFRNIVKTHLESCLGQISGKPAAHIVFSYDVNKINSMSIGFLLWLSKEYVSSLTVEVYNRELYDILDVIGLTKVWTVTLNENKTDAR